MTWFTITTNAKWHAKTTLKLSDTLTSYQQNQHLQLWIVQEWDPAHFLPMLTAAHMLLCTVHWKGKQKPQKMLTAILKKNNTCNSNNKKRAVWLTAWFSTTCLAAGLLKNMIHIASITSIQQSPHSCSSDRLASRNVTRQKIREWPKIKEAPEVCFKQVAIETAVKMIPLRNFSQSVLLYNIQYSILYNIIILHSVVSRKEARKILLVLSWL